MVRPAALASPCGAFGCVPVTVHLLSGAFNIPAWRMLGKSQTHLGRTERNGVIASGYRQGDSDGTVMCLNSAPAVLQ